MSGIYEVTLVINNHQPGRARAAARKMLLKAIAPDMLAQALADMNFDLVSKRVTEQITDY